jgi:hypothetical protein
MMTPIAASTKPVMMPAANQRTEIIEKVPCVGPYKNSTNFLGRL